MLVAAELERVFRARHRMLWGLCYRLTGVAADADEVVQDAYVRALERALAAQHPERAWSVVAEDDPDAAPGDSRGCVGGREPGRPLLHDPDGREGRATARLDQGRGAQGPEP